VQAFRAPLTDAVSCGGVSSDTTKPVHHSCMQDHDHSDSVCTSETETAASRDMFESQLRSVITSSVASSFIIANYSRKAMDQTGDGHFSPIGGYNQARGLVLIMDVARFKYPPYWVHIDTLWESMRYPDKATGSSRGYFVVSSDHCYIPITPNNISIR